MKEFLDIIAQAKVDVAKAGLRTGNSRLASTIVLALDTAWLAAGGPERDVFAPYEALAREQLLRKRQSKYADIIPGLSPMGLAGFFGPHMKFRLRKEDPFSIGPFKFKRLGCDKVGVLRRDGSGDVYEGELGIREWLRGGARLVFANGTMFPPIDEPTRYHTSEGKFHFEPARFVEWFRGQTCPSCAES